MFLEEVGKYFITVSTMAGVVTYIAKHIFDTSTKAVLEKYKNELKKDFEKEKNELKQQYDKSTRQREELKKWANPVLASVKGLAGRLNNIVTQEGHKELHYNHPQYEYYYTSTLYYFAQYLCWIQILKEEINYEIFGEKEKEQKFFTSLRDVNVVLRNAASPKPIFSLQQRHIAEIMMTESSGRRTCMSYNDFIEKLNNDQKFIYVLEPLKVLVDNMKKPDEYTKTILGEVVKLQQECQGLLRS